MAIADDIDYDLSNLILKRKTGASSTKHHTKELWLWLTDEFDKPDLMKYDVPISRQTETSFTVINKWYIQEDLTKYIIDGSIETLGYDNEIRTLVCGSIGWIDFVEDDIGNTITGTITENTGTILDYNNTKHKIWIRMNTPSDIFNSATEEYTQVGIGAATAISTSITGETAFANLYTIGTFKGMSQLDIIQDDKKLDIEHGHIDTSIKVIESGVDIDNHEITVLDPNKTNLPDRYQITLSTSGQNPIPIGWTGEFSNVYSYKYRGLNNGNS